MLRKGNGGAAHHEVAVCHMVGQQAGEGLEDLAHGAIADDDEALPREALGEVRGVHPVQVAGVGLEDLPELLHQQVTQVCALRLSTLWRVFHGEGCPNGCKLAAAASSSLRASELLAAKQARQSYSSLKAQSASARRGMADEHLQRCCTGRVAQAPELGSLCCIVRGRSCCLPDVSGRAAWDVNAYRDWRTVAYLLLQHMVLWVNVV